MIDYFSGGNSSPDLLLVTDGYEDDQFAIQVLSFAEKLQVNDSGLIKRILDVPNKYGLTHVLVAPSSFHSYFKGRLDDQRSDLFLVLPISDCEYSGDESLSFFTEMRQRINSGLDWNRSVCPKILIRFDNPKTSAGTGNSDGVPVDFELVKSEIENLNGVNSGFVEVTNYMGDYAEVLSPTQNQFTFCSQSDSKSSSMSLVDAIDATWKFLVKSPI